MKIETGSEWKTDKETLATVVLVREDHIVVDMLIDGELNRGSFAPSEFGRLFSPVSELMTETQESKEFEAMFETVNADNADVAKIAKRFARSESERGMIGLRVDEDSIFYADTDTVQAYIDDLLADDETPVAQVYSLELEAETWDPSYYVEKHLLNGADDWRHYSEGGAALCYDCEISDRFGISIETVRENGLELQGLALRKACSLIIQAVKFIFA